MLITEIKTMQPRLCTVVISEHSSGSCWDCPRRPREGSCQGQAAASQEQGVRGHMVTEATGEPTSLTVRCWLLSVAHLGKSSVLHRILEMILRKV